MFQAPAPAENPTDFQRITQIPRNSPTQSANYAKFAVLLTYSILCFRHLPQQRTFRNSSELRKFRAICPHSLRIPQNLHYSINLFYIMFQAPAPAENPTDFQRITQIPRNSPTQSANYAKFAVLLTYSILCFRQLPQQRTLRNSSELRKFCTIRPHSLRITRNLPFC